MPPLSANIALRLGTNRNFVNDVRSKSGPNRSGDEPLTLATNTGGSSFLRLLGCSANLVSG